MQEQKQTPQVDKQESSDNVASTDKSYNIVKITFRIFQVFAIGMSVTAIGALFLILTSSYAVLPVGVQQSVLAFIVTQYPIRTLVVGFVALFGSIFARYLYLGVLKALITHNDARAVQKEHKLENSGLESSENKGNNQVSEFQMGSLASLANEKDRQYMVLQMQILDLQKRFQEQEKQQKKSWMDWASAFNNIASITVAIPAIIVAILSLIALLHH